jgi:diacylglycerol kinase (ATP)
MNPAAPPPQNNTGIARIGRAFFYSRDGFIAAYKNEAAFRQEVWLALVLIPLSFFLPVGILGKALMIASVLLVLIVELLNSAVEAIVDLASPEQHELAKRAKDMGSAAVLISLVNVGCVWLGVWLTR